MSKDNEPELVRVVPELNEKTYPLVSALWRSYNRETCDNYATLEHDTGLDRDELKKLLEPFKKLGFVFTVRGLMTEDGEVAGSGFTVNGRDANQLLELAMYRYNYGDNPFGRAEDYVPKVLNVGGHTYQLKVTN